MAEVLRLRATNAQRALARYREEEQAFQVVLRAAAEWRRADLFLRVFSLYRARMMHLRNVLGPSLPPVDVRSAGDELRDLGDGRPAPVRPPAGRRGAKPRKPDRIS